MFGQSPVALQPSYHARPVEGYTRGDGETIFGVMDRGSQCAVETDGAVRLQRRFPRFHRAGHGHGMDRGADLGKTLRAQGFGRRFRRGTARAVIAPGGLIWFSQHHEAVAADAGHVRLDDAERRASGHRSVGRVAAVSQHVDCREARQWMRRRRHAGGRNDRRAARKLEISAHV
jgi:hypothetical protein